MMYAYVAPSGVIVEDTVARTKWEAWDSLYHFLATVEPEWGERYWKRLKPSQASARRRGYRLVRVKLVEVDK